MDLYEGPIETFIFSDRTVRVYTYQVDGKPVRVYHTNCQRCERVILGVEPHCCEE